MKRLITILALAALACGVSTAGMTPAVPASPTTTSAPQRSAPVKPTSTDEPRKAVVIVETANVRGTVDGVPFQVIGQVKRGDELTLIGEPVREGSEVWQNTDRGYIDSALIEER